MSLVLGCSSNDDASPSDPSGQPGDAGIEASDAGASGPTGSPSITFSDHEEGRYCEVLIARPGESGGLVADVWNSIAFGSCPQEQWEALDADAIKADFPDAALVLLNGPRFFLMQEIYQNGPQQVPELHTFGDIRMSLAATVAIDPTQAGAYVERSVDRETTFRWKSGRRVFELSSPDGKTYVMQSFSRIEDPDLAFDELPSLGSRIEPPAGWTFDTRVLEADLDVTAHGVATVVQDELANTYQLLVAQPE